MTRKKKTLHARRASQYLRDVLAYLFVRCGIAFRRRFGKSGNDVLIEAVGFGCQVLIFAHQLC
jgi:hypothetical protein